MPPDLPSNLPSNLAAAETELIKATIRGDLACVAALLAQGTNPDATGSLGSLGSLGNRNTPLM